MFLVNSRLRSFAAARCNLAVGGQTILLTYDRFFAEFLNPYCPVRLRILSSSTCVGLRYDFKIIGPRRFSWKLGSGELALRPSSLLSTLQYTDPARLAPFGEVT